MKIPFNGIGDLTLDTTASNYGLSRNIMRILGEQGDIGTKIIEEGKANGECFEVTMTINGKEFDPAYLNDLVANQLEYIKDRAKAMADEICVDRLREIKGD